MNRLNQIGRLGKLSSYKSRQSSWTPQNPLSGETPDFWVKEGSRSGLTLTDSVDADNSPSILPACINVPLGTTPKFDLKTGVVPDANTIMIIRGAMNRAYTFYEGSVTGTDKFYLSAEDYGGQKWAMQWGNTYLRGAVAVDLNWHVLIMYDKRLWICSPDTLLTDDNIKNIIGTVAPDINISAASWTGAGATQIILLNYGYYLPVECKRALTFIGNLVAGTITWQKKYVFTNKYNAYDILGAGAKVNYTRNDGGITGFGNAPTLAFSAYGYDTLSIGHSICHKDGEPVISIPYNVGGTPITIPPTGFVILHDQEGDLLNHNLADSIIEFKGVIWDRSDTDIWKDGARAAGTYYDSTSATTKKRWHISELNQLQLYEWLNTDYLGRPFVKIDPNSVDIEERLVLKELFSYTTNKTGSDFIKILKYTKDYTLIII